MKCSIFRALNSIEIPNIKGLLTFCNDNIKKGNGKKKKKRSTSWIVFRGPSPNNPLRSKDVLNITTLWHFRWLDGNDTTMNKREERREKREEREVSTQIALHRSVASSAENNNNNMSNVNNRSSFASWTPHSASFNGQ